MTNIISSSIPSHQTKDESTSQVSALLQAPIPCFSIKSVSPLLQAPIPCFSIKSVSPCFKLSQHHIIAMQCLSSRRYNKISASHTPPIHWYEVRGTVMLFSQLCATSGDPLPQTSYQLFRFSLLHLRCSRTHITTWFEEANQTTKYLKTTNQTR
jgi:hypothetical protein